MKKELFILLAILFLIVLFNNNTANSQNKNYKFFIEGEFGYLIDWSAESETISDGDGYKYQGYSYSQGYNLSFSPGIHFSKNFAVMLDIGWWKTSQSFDIKDNSYSTTYECKGSSTFFGPKLRVFAPFSKDFSLFIGAGFIYFMPNDYEVTFSDDTYNYKIKTQCNSDFGFRGEFGALCKISSNWGLTFLLCTDLVKLEKSNDEISGTNKSTNIRISVDHTYKDEISSSDRTSQIKEFIDASNFGIKIGFIYFF